MLLLRLPKSIPFDSKKKSSQKAFSFHRNDRISNIESSFEGKVAQNKIAETALSKGIPFDSAFLSFQQKIPRLIRRIHA